MSSSTEVECNGASSGEGVDVSRLDEAQSEVDEGKKETTIDINDQVIKKIINCDSVTINSNSVDGESKETEEQRPQLRPILTNGASSIPRLGSQGVAETPRKKSVSFDEVDECVKKFINGEPIVDKQNPFKPISRLERSTWRSKVQKANGRQEAIVNIQEDDYISKEEVLKESKFVKTYIKNPDKYFTYDPSIIERLRTPSDEQHSTTRIPTTKKPIPIPRKLSKNTKERLKELTIKYSPPKFYTEEKPPSTTKVNGLKRSNYPDLADIKVKTGTDWEPGLYNAQEVAINVKKFDNRFKKAQFGSQDDLDDIAEQTDADIEFDLGDGGAVKCDQDNGKKSFTNTVNSKEFREYLSKKGLTLIPQTDVSVESNGFLSACDDSCDRMDGKKKRSMLQRIFNGGLFSSRGKTTPREVTATPKSTDNVNTSPMKRVVLERASFHQTPTPGGNRTSLPANNEFHKVFGGRGKVRNSSEDYVDMNLAPSSTGQQQQVVKTTTHTRDVHENYIDMTPKLSMKKNTTAAAVHHVDSSTGANTILNAQNLYRTIDMSKSRTQPSRLRTPVIVRPQALRTEERPPVLRRTPVRQSLVQPRAKIPNDVMYGNLNRSNSLPRQPVRMAEPPPQLPQRNTRLGIVVNSESGPSENGGRNSRITAVYEKSTESITPSVAHGPKGTSTPVESNLKQENTQISQDLSPIVASTSVQVDPRTWIKLKELKDRTDRNLLYSTPPSNKPIPIVENIYESTEKFHPAQQYGRIVSGRRSSMDREGLAERTPVMLVRNSPQRSTIDTVYRNRNMKIVDGHCVDPQAVHQMTNTPVTRERSQSVLEGVTSPAYGTVGQMHQDAVMMRKRQPVYMSREEILSKVKEFCRKSMNNTPTKEQQPQVQVPKGSTEISPVSYASVDSRMSGRVAPQVPRRVESLQKLPESPIYAPVYRQAMPQVQRTPNPVAMQLNTEKNNEIIDSRPHYQAPPGHLIQVGDQIYAPIRRAVPSAMYGIAPAHEIPSPYGYLHLRNHLSGIPPKTPRPASVQANPYQRRPIDGRTTPLVLHSVVPRVDQVIYSRPMKQFPRPVDMKHHQNVPYESESGSEAGEIQRILQKKNGE
ncbi:hypothetical protein DMENIID0001_154250 [Sergentomyia squamirostris]